ncbi:hypothetical protein CEXT_696041 [Caerostris extrusa]|uniref:Uncharacterized protein n=1 Tax=Caerostris extrusa TaxID=172846 RepID=A0AAV4RYZ2_CAEEX|nr:hypothetical protein CEXT_696041 [Caerostris extrusa]
MPFYQIGNIRRTFSRIFWNRLPRKGPFGLSAEPKRNETLIQCKRFPISSCLTEVGSVRNRIHFRYLYRCDNNLQDPSCGQPLLQIRRLPHANVPLPPLGRGRWHRIEKMAILLQEKPVPRADSAAMDTDIVCRPPSLYHHPPFSAFPERADSNT